MVANLIVGSCGANYAKRRSIILIDVTLSCRINHSIGGFEIVNLDLQSRMVARSWKIHPQARWAWSGPLAVGVTGIVGRQSPCLCENRAF
jgi:hypothetical protein